MRLVLLGASGHTGSAALRLALARGHTVVAVARDVTAVDTGNGGVTTFAADATDRQALAPALHDGDAVVCAVGTGTSRAPTELYSRTAANLAAALPAGTPVAVVSAAPAGPRAEQRPLERRLLMPGLDRLFGATYADMRAMEATLAASRLRWVALRPPRLVAGPVRGRCRCAPAPLPRARSIAFADLAGALLDAVEPVATVRGAVYVSA